MNLTINVNNINTYPSLTPITAMGTNITINGTTTSNVNTVTQAVTNNTYVTISITSTGYNTYTNTFKIYDYNLTLDIILVPIVVDPSDPTYLKPYPYIQVINIPCSYNKEVINASSAPSGIISYSQDGTLINYNNINTFTTFLCPGTALVTQTKQVTNPLTGLVVWTISYSTTITILEYKPNLSLDIVFNSSCSTCDCDCIPLGQSFTITPSVILNLNNQPTPTCADSTLLYQLYNYSGTLVDTVSYVINNFLPIDDTTLTYTYTPTLIGDYILTVTLQNCCTTCIVNKTISICEYIKIINNGCHNYTIQNCSTSSSKDSYYTITDLDNNIIDSQNNIALVHGASNNIITPKDGVYKFIIKNSSLVTIGTYLVIDICTISTCLISRIQNIICDCDCKDKNNHESNCIDYCKETYILDRMILVGYDLLSRVNREYRLNSLYTTLDTTTLDQMTTTQNDINKLLDYCSQCGCGSNSSTNISSINSNNNSSDCGCGN